MNDKSLERALNNIECEVNDVFILLRQKIEQLEKDLIQAEEHRKKSLKIEFEKGYIEGVKYTDRLISEEKKFPF
jgi:hypothetical protein